MISDATIWIEWVPNISTGRDPEFIDSLKIVFDQIPDLYLLHTDQGADVNRTVLTVVGTQKSLREAVLQLLPMLEKKIFMDRHRGAHPRLGALDVSPFIPLNKEDKPEVIRWVKELAREISDKFTFPVFLYEDSATAEHRRKLADIRRGEYEGLELKIRDPDWLPDFGNVFHPGLGATVMGVRRFLIAYNVNLSTKDIAIARSMASRLRDRESASTKYFIPGLKAIGWYLEDEDICQVSTNITNIDLAHPLMVFDRCKKLAEIFDTEVTGSELIGLIPHRNVDAMMKNRFSDTKELTRYLGLQFAGISDIRERTIEYQLYRISGQKLFTEKFEEV